MASNILEIIIRARDQASGVLGKFSSSLGEGLSSLTGKLFSLQSGLVGLTSAGGIGFLVKSFTDTAGQVETLQLRLESMTKSTVKAKEKFEAFRDFAAISPFTLEDVSNAGVQLEAFGLKSEKTLKVLGDLAAFMGVDIKEAAGALGRAFAGGAGAADILRERGVLNLIKDFASLKYGIDDLTKIALPEFQRILLEALSDPGGKIAGATAKLANTFLGQMSMLSDAIFEVKLSLGNALLPVLKDLVTNHITPVVKNLAEWIKQNKELIEQKFDLYLSKIVAVGESLITSLPKIAGNIQLIYGGIKPIIDGYLSLPGGVQSIGILGALLFGVKGAALTIGALGLLGGAIKGTKIDLLMHDIDVYSKEIIKKEAMIAKLKTEGGGLIGKVFDLFGGPSTKERVEIELAEVARLRKKLKEAQDEFYRLYSEGAKELVVTKKPEEKPIKKETKEEEIIPEKNIKLTKEQTTALDKFKEAAQDAGKTRVEQLDAEYQGLLASLNATKATDKEKQALTEAYWKQRFVLVKEENEREIELFKKSEEEKEKEAKDFNDKFAAAGKSRLQLIMENYAADLELAETYNADKTQIFAHYSEQINDLAESLQKEEEERQEEKEKQTEDYKNRLEQEREYLQEHGDSVGEILSAHFEEYSENIQSTASIISDAIINIAEQLESAITDSIYALIVDFESLGDVITNLWQGILKSVIALLVQFLAQKLIMALMGKSIATSEATTNAAKAAMEIYGNSFASAAAIPLIGWEIAPGIAAANLAMGIIGMTGAMAAGAAVGAGGIALAEGGIVTSPTMALIGEAGPEAVIPLKKVFKNKTNEGISITNNFNLLDPSGLDESVIFNIANKLEKAISEVQRRRG